MEAFRWVAYGFSLFAAAPVSWALLALVGGVVYALPFAVPVLGVVLGSVALPGFYAALVLAAESADHLEPVRIAALGDAWDWRRTLSLLRIGLAQLLVSVFVGLVATYADQQLDKLLLVAVNLVLALYFLFAVAIVTLTNRGAREALTMAGAAVLGRPLHVLLLSSLVLGIVALGALSAVGLLIALPVMGASVYAASNDLFGVGAAD